MVARASARRIDIHVDARLSTGLGTSAETAR
jgi:hypothetical protein